MITADEAGTYGKKGSRKRDGGFSGRGIKMSAMVRKQFDLQLAAYKDY